MATKTTTNKTTTSSVKKTNPASAKTTATETKVESQVEEEVVEEVKKYEQEDLIPCKSITSGPLYVEGTRSGFLYTWADYGDSIDVEYRDLVYMIRSNDKNIYEPRFVVDDSNLVSEYPKLQKVYDALYTVNDLREILNMDAREMEVNIKALPTGAQNALKGIAVTMIDEHQLDSVTKIKTLDEIFGTNMLLTLTQE